MARFTHSHNLRKNSLLTSPHLTSLGLGHHLTRFTRLRCKKETASKPQSWKFYKLPLPRSFWKKLTNFGTQFGQLGV